MPKKLRKEKNDARKTKQSSADVSIIAKKRDESGPNDSPKPDVSKDAPSKKANQGVTENPQGSDGGVQQDVQLERNVFMDPEGNMNPVAYGMFRPSSYEENYREQQVARLLDLNRDEEIIPRFQRIQRELERKPASGEDSSFLDDVQAGLKTSYNNFTRAVNDAFGTDLQEYSVPKGDIRETVLYNLFGAQLGTVVATGGLAIGAIMGTPALLTLMGSGLTISAITAWGGSYGDREDAESQFESGIVDILNMTGVANDEGFIPDNNEGISQREMAMRIFIADLFDAATLGGAFKLAGKAVKRGSKGVPSFPIDASEEGIKEAAASAERTLKLMDEKAIARISDAENISLEEARSIYDQGMRSLSQGKADDVIANLPFSRALARSADLAVADELNLKQVSMKKQVDQVVEQMKKAQKSVVPGQASKKPMPRKTQPPPVPGSDEAMQALAAMARGVGRSLDKVYKNPNEQTIASAVEQVKKAILAEPDQVKVAKKPRKDVVEDIKKSPAEDVLDKPKAETGTGSEILSLIEQKHRVLSLITDQIGKGDTKTFNSLRELDELLTVWGGRKATKHGGNLQAYSRFLEIEPILRQTREGLKVLNNKYDLGLESAENIQKQKKRIKKAMDSAFIKATEDTEISNKALNHMKRMAFNYMLSEGALARALTGNAIAPFLENASQAGLRLDRLAKFQMNIMWRSLKNIYQTLASKEGRGVLKDIYMSEGKDYSRHSIGYMAGLDRGVPEKAFTLMTNLWSGSLSAMDYLMRDAIEEAAARTVWRDIINRRLANGESPKYIADITRSLMSGDEVKLGPLLEYQKNLKNLTDGIFTRGGVETKALNARGETHSVLSIGAAMAHDAMKALSQVIAVKDHQLANPLMKGAVTGLRFFTDVSRGFVNVGTAQLNYLNDYIPVLGTRRRAADLGWDGVFNTAGRALNPFAMTRKQTVGLTLASSVWGLNALTNDEGSIKFQIEPFDERKKYRQFSGRTGLRVGEYVLDSDLMSTFGDFFTLLHKAKDTLTFPIVSAFDEKDEFVDTFNGTLARYIDLVLSDTYLSTEYGNILTDIMAADPREGAARRLYRKGKEMIYPVLVPWAPIEDKYKRFMKGGIQQVKERDPVNYYKEKLGAVTDELKELAKDLPDEPRADMFGTPWTQGENYMDQQLFYSRWGAFIRTVHPTKGSTPKANVIRDYMVLTGMMSDSKEVEVNGKVIPKKWLPGFLQLTMAAPTRQAQISPIFTQGLPYVTDLSYKLYNRRQRILGYDFKYIHELIDGYKKFYQSYPAADTATRNKTRSAIIALDNMKTRVFAPNMMRRQIRSYKKGYHTVDILYDILKNESAITRTAYRNIKNAILSSANLDQAGIELTRPEAEELASRFAKMINVKTFYDASKISANALIGLDPELFLEAQKLIGDEQ